MQIGFIISRMVRARAGTIGEKNGSTSNQQLRLASISPDKLTAGLFSNSILGWSLICMAFETLDS